MRALVTGATGFVGSYVTRKLICEGATVAILRRESSNLSRLNDILTETTQIVGDLSALENTENVIRDFAPDTIFHLGWQNVSGEHRNTEVHIDRNLMDSVNLARLALSMGCDAFVGLGSQAEYGQFSEPISEDAHPKPTSIYGVAKLCTYLLLNQLFSQEQTRFIWIRLFSSYGPQDNPGWMLPYVIRTLLAGERPSLTAGEQLWDYLFVEDAAEAIVQTAQRPEAHGIFNLGSGEALPIVTIVEMIRDMIDANLPLGMGDRPYRPDQVMHLQADISRLKHLTSWQPRTSLKHGLTQTIESMKL